ncbi:DUF397 domain-containing protein [Nocardia sp. NPDC057440]|uniref:DUF397 domain-containing protein n=1 Tax=Nocardia sp. NPDC057440 TaxID=3346134 RepID=UPI00367215CE
MNNRSWPADIHRGLVTRPTTIDGIACGTDDVRLRDCVAVAFLGSGVVGVRDRKNPTGPVLALTPGEWGAFTAGVNDGRLDRP